MDPWAITRFNRPYRAAPSVRKAASSALLRGSADWLVAPRPPSVRSYIPSESSVREEAELEVDVEDVDLEANTRGVGRAQSVPSGEGGRPRAEQGASEDDTKKTHGRSRTEESFSDDSLPPHAQNRWLQFHDAALERKYQSTFAGGDGWECALVIASYATLAYGTAFIRYSGVFKGGKTSLCEPYEDTCPTPYWLLRLLTTVGNFSFSIFICCVLRFPALKRKVLPHSQCFFFILASLNVLIEEAWTCHLELRAPWWARCEYNEENCSNAHVRFQMVKWTWTYVAFSYLRMSYHTLVMLTALVFVTTLPMLVPWGTGRDAEGHQWQINRQDSFTPVFGGVSLLIPAMIVIQSHCTECLRRVQFVLIQLLGEKASMDHMHNMAPKRLGQRTSRSSSDQELFVEQFATLTVLNCRLSTSDIERITKEEGQLVCLQTLRRLVDVFDHLVRQHDCHKAEHINNTYRVVPAQVNRGRTVSSADEDSMAEDAALMVALACEMMYACASVSTPQGRCLRPSIGLASGCGVGAVIGGHRRFYRVYGDAVQTSIALSATAQYSQILLAESTRKLVPRALCVTRRLKMVQPEARLSIQSKADLKETRSELARSVERQRPVFEVVVGDFERRLLKEAVPDILGERPASKLDRESATSRDSETDLKLVDTSSYGRLGSYNEAAVEQAYQAHTASHDLSGELTRHTRIRLGIHVLLFAAILLTTLLHENELGSHALHGALPERRLFGSEATSQVFVALAACAVLLADVVVHVYRTRLTALSCWCLGRSWGLFLVQLPSGMLVWLAVGCELMGERRMSLVMYIIGLLDLQSPWDTSGPCQLVLMGCLPTAAMLLAVCIPKAPSLNNYPYYAVLACVVASVVSWRWSKIHRREMWKLERELNARYDDVLRNLATFIPSDLACDAVIRQRVNKRLRPTEDEAQHVWLEPDVKEGAVLSCFMVLPAALEAAEAATILHEITLILDAELVKCQSRPGVIPVVLKTPASEEESSAALHTPYTASMSTSGYLQRRRQEILATPIIPESTERVEHSQTCTFRADQNAQPLIRLDHAAPHSYHVATTSNDVAGIALLLSVASSMNTAVQRYTEGGAHGLSPNLMSVQWGLGTGSMWSGLFPSIPTYHCFGEAYIKSERLAARSRAFQVRMQSQVASQNGQTTFVDFKVSALPTPIPSPLASTLPPTSAPPSETAPPPLLHTSHSPFRRALHDVRKGVRIFGKRLPLGGGITTFP